MIAWQRERAGSALAAPTASLTPGQRNQIRSLSVSLNELGNIQRYQDDPDCLPHLQEALKLAQRIGDRAAEAHEAGSVGNAYLYLSGLRDLGQAEHWFQHSLSLRPDSDQLGRAMILASLGTVDLERFNDAKAAGEAGPVLLEHLSTALHHCQQALDLTPADDHPTRAATENQLGLIYDRAGDTRQALRHFQQAIQHNEARGNIFGAGQTRYNIAILLDGDGRTGDALQYARAALDSFQRVRARRRRPALHHAAADRRPGTAQPLTGEQPDRRMGSIRAACSIPFGQAPFCPGAAGPRCNDGNSSLAPTGRTCSRPGPAVISGSAFLSVRFDKTILIGNGNTSRRRGGMGLRARRFTGSRHPTFARVGCLPADGYTGGDMAALGSYGRVLVAHCWSR
jgi:Flp pilus assembly protein TadD